MTLIIDVSTKCLSCGLEILFHDEIFLYTASSFHIFGISSTSKGNELYHNHQNSSFQSFLTWKVLWF